MVILQGEPIELQFITLQGFYNYFFHMGLENLTWWVGWGCISSSNTIHSLLLNSSDSRCRLQGGVTHNTTRIRHGLQQYKNVLISSWAKYLFVFLVVVIVSVQAHLHHRMMLEHYYYYCQVPTFCVLRGTLLFNLVCIQIYRQGL